MTDLRYILPVTCLLLGGCNLQNESVPQTENSAAAYRFVNAVWFDGEGFVERTVDVIDGRLAAPDDARTVVTPIDLEGAYVIPPLCEAHNHNLGDSADSAEIDPTIAAYLEYGVFYAMMQGSFALYRDQLTGNINHPRSIDVAFANNGLTGVGGHPRKLRETLMDRYGNYPEFTTETLPDAGYFEAETAADVAHKMDLIIAEKPDFVKVMLLHSEEYERRKDDETYYGSRGLDPALLPDVVRLSHANGLRVSVHIESNADLITAIEAGADMIAHLPSHDGPTVISDMAARQAADSQIPLITTLSIANRFKDRDPERYAETIGVQSENLRKLDALGANLVLGSDSVRDVSYGEALHLESLDALDSATLLTMWTERCGRTVFPDRQIGRLDAGYEASFLALEANPLDGIEAVRSVRLRVKDGQILDLTEPEAR